MARFILHLCSLSSANLLWALASSLQEDSCDVTDATAACTTREVEVQEHEESAAARIEMLQVTSKQTLQEIHEKKEKRSDADENDIEVCHGCLLHGLCLQNLVGRLDCDNHDGIWHQEDPTTALVTGEIAEMMHLSALDVDGDGLISGIELKQMLMAMGEKPTEDDILCLMSSIDNTTSQYAAASLLDTNKGDLLPLLLAPLFPVFAVVKTVATVAKVGYSVGKVAYSVGKGALVVAKGVAGVANTVASPVVAVANAVGSATTAVGTAATTVAKVGAAAVVGHYAIKAIGGDD